MILLRSHHGCSQPRAGFLARAGGADGSCCGHRSVQTALAGEASFSSSSSCYSSAGERWRCLKGGKTKDTASLGGSLQNTMPPAPHIGEENSAAKPISALQSTACSPICAAPASPNPIHPTPAPSRWKEAGGSSPRAPQRGQPRATRSPRCDRSRSLPARSDSSFHGTAWLHNCLLKRKPDTKQKAVFWGANQCVLIPACASLTAPFSTPLSVLFLFSSPGSPGICGVIAGIQPELWGHGALWGCSTGSGTRTLLLVLFQVSSHRSTKHNLLWRGLRSLDKSSLITEGNNPLRKTWRKTFSHAGEK